MPKRDRVGKKSQNVFFNMKKTFLFFAGVLLFCSCAKDNYYDDPLPVERGPEMIDIPGGYIHFCDSMLLNDPNANYSAFRRSDYIGGDVYVPSFRISKHPIGPDDFVKFLNSKKIPYDQVRVTVNGTYTYILVNDYAALCDLTYIDYDPSTEKYTSQSFLSNRGFLLTFEGVKQYCKWADLKLPTLDQINYIYSSQLDNPCSTEDVDFSNQAWNGALGGSSGEGIKTHAKDRGILLDLNKGYCQNVQASGAYDNQWYSGDESRGGVSQYPIYGLNIIQYGDSHGCSNNSANHVAVISDTANQKLESYFDFESLNDYWIEDFCGRDRIVSVATIVKGAGKLAFMPIVPYSYLLLAGDAGLCGNPQRAALHSIWELPHDDTDDDSDCRWGTPPYIYVVKD